MPFIRVSNRVFRIESVSSVEFGPDLAVLCLDDHFMTFQGAEADTIRDLFAGTSTLITSAHPLAVIHWPLHAETRAVADNEPVSESAACPAITLEAWLASHYEAYGSAPREADPTPASEPESKPVAFREWL